MELTYLPLVLIFGLIVGSFLAALSYRIPLGISISKGRSFCPKCKRKICWYDNIPLFSYLVLDGKCRDCGRKISLRYPFIEAATGIGFLLIFSFQCSMSSLENMCLWKNSLGGLYIPFLLFIFSLLVAIFIIDLEKQIIPDSLVFSLFIVTSLFLIIFRGEVLFENLLVGFGASLFLLLLYLVTKGKGMGLGDVKFALFSGIFLGWPQTLLWLFVSFVIGALTGLALILAKKASFGKHIPFGPFLVVSFFISILFGERILGWLNL